jgi:hypothetical protein
MKAPLKVSDFNLSPEQMKDLVEGAQKYLGPLEDPRDNDPVFKRSSNDKPLDEDSKG